MEKNDQVKISEILVSILNDNIGNRLSQTLAIGILNVFNQHLNKLIEEDKEKDIKEENYNK